MSDGPERMRASRIGPVLETIPFFAGLGPSEREQIARAARMKRYAAGTLVIERGDPAETLFAVSTGRLKVVAPRQGGRDATLRILGPGQVFGELALLDAGGRSARVTALTESVLLLLHRREFLDLHARSRAVADRLVQLLASRLRDTVSHFEQTISLDAAQRLASKLCSLADELGEPCPGGVRLGLQLSQRDLGDLADTTRQTVNRLLGEWTRAGWIEERDGFLVIRDVAALRSRSGAEA